MTIGVCLLGNADLKTFNFSFLNNNSFATSAMGALQVEAGEMPLWLKRKQLAANYWIHVRGQRDDHPTKGVLLVS